MLHHTVCKCFSLAVGEDVYDLRLPLVSRIPDIDDMVWISCHLPSLVLSFIICIYFFFSLSYVLWLCLPCSASILLNLQFSHLNITDAIATGFWCWTWINPRPSCRTIRTIRHSGKYSSVKYWLRNGKIPLSEYHAAVGKKPIVTWYFTVPEMVNGHFTRYQIWYSTVCGLVFYWFTHGII